MLLAVSSRQEVLRQIAPDYLAYRYDAQAYMVVQEVSTGRFVAVSAREVYDVAPEKPGTYELAYTLAHMAYWKFLTNDCCVLIAGNLYDVKNGHPKP